MKKIILAIYLLAAAVSVYAQPEAGKVFFPYSKKYTFSLPQASIQVELPAGTGLSLPFIKKHKGYYKQDDNARSVYYFADKDYLLQSTPIGLAMQSDTVNMYLVFISAGSSTVKESVEGLSGYTVYKPLKSKVGVFSHFSAEESVEKKMIHGYYCEYGSNSTLLVVTYTTHKDGLKQCEKLVKSTRIAPMDSMLNEYIILDADGTLDKLYK